MIAPGTNLDAGTPRRDRRTDRRETCDLPMADP